MSVLVHATESLHAPDCKLAFSNRQPIGPAIPFLEGRLGRDGAPRAFVFRDRDEAIVGRIWSACSSDRPCLVTPARPIPCASPGRLVGDEEVAFLVAPRASYTLLRDVVHEVVPPEPHGESYELLWATNRLLAASPWVYARLDPESEVPVYLFCTRDERVAGSVFGSTPSSDARVCAAF